MERKHYETLVFHFESEAARKALFDLLCPTANPMKSTVVPGVRVVGMACYDVMEDCRAFEEAIQTIAGGDGDAWEIANETWDRAGERRRVEIDVALGKVA